MSGAEPNLEQTGTSGPLTQVTTRVGSNQPAPGTAAERTAAADFARQAGQAPPGLLAEFWDFLIHNKKWWLTPIILVLLLAAAFVLLSGTTVGPFIYPGL
ncbi:MAG TPA: DUF5989 family protein [Planctomycetaceae bacterium]|nr:DUF5989 family protein [Planctomycetaceae bacterium]